MLVLDLVMALRREIPGLGTRKLHLLLGGPLAESGIKLGRDKLHKILQDHNLVLRQRRQVPKTTDSDHGLKKYPNLLIDRVISGSGQVWVCDITYLCVGLILVQIDSVVFKMYGKQAKLTINWRTLKRSSRMAFTRC